MNKWFLSIMTVALLTACEKMVVVYADDNQQEDGLCRVTFSVGGDFGGMTRAIAVGESNMTDLWVYDYVGGEHKKGERQMSTQSGFGTVTMVLPYGRHSLYFVASRGTDPSEDVSDVISWRIPGDTFWASVELDINNGMAKQVDVRLKRVATCLMVAIDDVVPSGMQRISVSPSVWYYGLNYVTGEACEAANKRERSVDVPGSYVGTSGMSVSFYGLSGTKEWTADFDVTAYNADDVVIGKASVANAPFRQNRVTRYSGKLFSSDAGFSVTLDDEWDDRYDGKW